MKWSTSKFDHFKKDDRPEIDEKTSRTKKKRFFHHGLVFFIMVYICTFYATARDHDEQGDQTFELRVSLFEQDLKKSGVHKSQMLNTLTKRVSLFWISN